jgi:N-acetylglucosamine transport system permease protein
VTAITANTVPGGRNRRAVRDGRPGRRLSFDNVSFFAVFLGLPVTVFAVFVLWPFAQAAYYALTDWGGFSPDYNVIGLENFGDLWSDKLFRRAVRNNVILAVVVPLATIVVALTFATLMTIGGSSHGQLQGVRGSGFYRVVSFFPYVVPAIVIGLIWSKIFDPTSGLLNGTLTKLGLDQFEAFAWLGEQSTARWAVIFVVMWGFVGFYMVLFIAAIKGIPAELYDAARIDGCGRLRMTFAVTIPMIRDAVQTAYIYLGIFALDAFVYVQAMTPTGGPENSTLTISQRLFRTAFTEGKFGYASAMGVVLAAVTLLFAGVVFTVNWLTGGRDKATRS